MSSSLAVLLEQAASQGRPVILDGAVGTEIDRRGAVTDGRAWSARAMLERPDLVLDIHRKYIEAGAEVILADTFRTTARSFRAAGIRASWKEAAQKAVRLALEAASGRALVAASIGPLEECYAPRLAPSAKEAYAEHRSLIEAVIEAGASLVWIETMNTAREAETAAGAAQDMGVPFVVSFVPDMQGRILDGTAFSKALDGIEHHGPAAILINCAPPRMVDAALPELRKATGLPLGVKAHLGVAEPDQGWSGSAWLEPQAFARKGLEWFRNGAALVGGCCGSRPAHIAALAHALRADRGASKR